MTYPIFVNNGPASPMSLVLLTCALSGLIYITTRRDIQLKITKGYSPDYARIYARSHNHPNVIKITHVNTECLRNKGYKINDNMSLYSSLPLYSYMWTEICYVSKPTPDHEFRKSFKPTELTKEQFTSDCKECNVYTDVIYEYNTIFGNEKQKKKRLYWHRYYKDELI